MNLFYRLGTVLLFAFFPSNSAFAVPKADYNSEIKYLTDSLKQEGINNVDISIVKKIHETSKGKELLNQGYKMCDMIKKYKYNNVVNTLKKNNPDLVFIATIAKKNLCNYLD